LLRLLKIEVDLAFGHEAVYIGGGNSHFGSWLI
jgi:hypothetical protein